MEEHLNRFRILYLGLLSAVFFSAMGVTAARRGLWYDELFTFYVAKLPDPMSVLQALLNKADNHPPADYLIRHFSIRIFGESELAVRLPSMIALWLGSLCLYGFAEKRSGAVPGLVSFCFLMSTNAAGYAREARGYSLWIASLCLALWSWQRATENSRSLVALGSLAAALALGPYSHFYGVLNYAPILVGEAVRSFENRRLSMPIVFSIMASFVFLLPLYPFVQNAREYVGGFWAGTFAISTPFTYYYSLLHNTLLAAGASLISCTVIISLKETTRPQPNHQKIPIHEIAAAVTLCLVPFIAYGLAVIVTGALTLRYTLVTNVGFALLMAYVTSFVARTRGGCAVAILLSFYLTLLFNLTLQIRDSLQAGKPSIPESFKQFIIRADLPVVFADPGGYLETYHYSSKEVRDKIYFLTDRNSAKKYAKVEAGATANEIALSHLKQIVPINLVDFSEFTRRYRQFVIVDRGGSWLMQKLTDERAALILHSLSGDGRVFFATLAH